MLMPITAKALRKANKEMKKAPRLRMTFFRQFSIAVYTWIWDKVRANLKYLRTMTGAAK
eukprot:CAMPEP_0182505690 /NCGR_PEP_ID=MMETSP1321-20130603/19729_1 /TAXON_ID=91990 /ORGANISM="Bolidomonas sp., Strain RCC1657" /LENGTH=58 /DNA_ID=CAMNT_0024711279 /DNA_START=734 /DNA_END=910 /DNA_ORIENTATION=-